MAFSVYHKNWFFHRQQSGNTIYIHDNDELYTLKLGELLHISKHWFFINKLNFGTWEVLSKLLFVDTIEQNILT